MREVRRTQALRALRARRRIGSARLNVSKLQKPAFYPEQRAHRGAAPIGSAPWPVAHAVPQGVLTVAMVPRQSTTGGKPRPTYYVAVPSGRTARSGRRLSKRSTSVVTINAKTAHGACAQPGHPSQKGGRFIGMGALSRRGR